MGGFFPKFQVQRVQTHLQLPGKTCSAPAAFRAAKAYVTLGKVWEAAARVARCEACRPGSSRIHIGLEYVQYLGHIRSLSYYSSAV